VRVTNHAFPFTTMRFLCLCLLAPLALPAAADINSAPPPPREMRAAWIATVRNIDWPSEPGLATAKQQQQLLTLIQKAADLRLNALVFQVRPAGDALYASELEPWSPFLTGKMGKAPEPGWDPLAFAIEECHQRGIELHAWFNPYRALAGEKFSASSTHIHSKYPDRTMKYGIDTWMDPGNPEVRAQTLAVMLDVTRRYDVDGIHIDDYFYPYPAKGKDGKMMPFPDDPSFQRYQAAGGRLDKSHWRRENVDTLVKELYQGIKASKKWVKFGISPFGLWRPNVPEGTGGGLDPYEDLSADSLKWLQQGWLDYMVPQLYWPIEPAKLSFTTYYDWWLSQNSLRRHIWPGMAVDRVGKDRGPGEILRQISVVRERGATMVPGHFHWNFGSLVKNTLEVADLTKSRAYQSLAVPPASPWLGAMELPAPRLTTLAKDSTGVAQWGMEDPRWLSHVRWWTVQTFADGKWTLHSIHPASTTEIPWPKGATAIALRAGDKTWTLSPAAIKASP
jgi:uncharacterized lipoprotein YddW (UPF0748 family)